MALLRASEILEKFKGDNEDETTGELIVRRALQAPIRQIAENSGMEASVVVQKILSSSNGMGLDAMNGQYVDLFKAGIVDPLKVTRTALENAVSIVGTILTFLKAGRISRLLIYFSFRNLRNVKLPGILNAMRALQGIKPQDVLILLKLAAGKDRSWRMVDLAQELGLSLSEVSMALERARRAGLIDVSKKKVARASLLEFILHGLKYVYPAEPGPLCRGMPTAHSAPPLSSRIVSSEQDQYVWPSADGGARGQAVEPLYGSAPSAASRDPELYRLLSLVDALRVGRARERQIAAEELKKRLHAL